MRRDGVPVSREEVDGFWGQTSVRLFYLDCVLSLLRVQIVHLSPVGLKRRTEQVLFWPRTAFIRLLDECWRDGMRQGSDIKAKSDSDSSSVHRR
jgi:hypothetical protein